MVYSGIIDYKEGLLRLSFKVSIGITYNKSMGLFFKERKFKITQKLFEEFLTSIDKGKLLEDKILPLEIL